MIFLFLYSTFPHSTFPHSAFPHSACSHSAFSHSACSHSPIPMIRFSHLLWSSPVVHTMLDLLHQMSLTLHSMVPVHTLTHSPTHTLTPLTHSPSHTHPHTLTPSHTHPHPLSLFPPQDPDRRLSLVISLPSLPHSVTIPESVQKREVHVLHCNTCIYMYIVTYM